MLVLCKTKLLLWMFIVIIGNPANFEVYSIQVRGFFRVPHQYNWSPRYNWSIVESGVKHHDLIPFIVISQCNVIPKVGMSLQPLRHSILSLSLFFFLNTLCVPDKQQIQISLSGLTVDGIESTIFGNRYEVLKPLHQRGCRI
jgi:hypothetical protein